MASYQYEAGYLYFIVFNEIDARIFLAGDNSSIMGASTRKAVYYHPDSKPGYTTEIKGDLGWSSPPKVIFKLAELSRFSTNGTFSNVKNTVFARLSAQYCELLGGYVNAVDFGKRLAHTLYDFGFSDVDMNSVDVTTALATAATTTGSLLVTFKQGRPVSSWTS